LQVRRDSISIFSPPTERGTMMWAKSVCLAASLLLASSAVAQAQVGRIAGTVVDSQTTQPINGARITVVGTTLVTGSDADGRFSVGGVPAGSHQIRVTRIGYTPVLQAVDVGSGATSSITVAMRAQAVQLNPV